MLEAMQGSLDLSFQYVWSFSNKTVALAPTLSSILDFAIQQLPHGEEQSVLAQYGVLQKRITKERLERQITQAQLLLQKESKKAKDHGYRKTQVDALQQAVREVV